MEVSVDGLLDEIAAELAERVAPRIAAELARTSLASEGPEEWRLLDVPEVARRLGRSERWVRDRTKRGDLAHIRLDGGALAFDPDDVRAFARARRVPLDESEPESPRRLRAVERGWVDG